MFYTLHGLRVRSDVAIPGLVPHDPATPDVEFVTREPVPAADASEPVWFTGRALDDAGKPVLVVTWLKDGQACRLRYSDGVTFVLERDGTKVWISWPPHLSLLDTTSYLLGPVIGILLRLRGITALHASAVEIDGRAIVFAGHAGAGKSTTVGAFAVRGFPIIADDTVTVSRRHDGWVTAPGYPRLRLWPDAANALDDPGRRTLLAPGRNGSTHRYHMDLTAPGRRFTGETLPIGAIYLLEPGSGHSFHASPVNAADAVFALAASVYGQQLSDRTQQAREFAELSELAGHVTVRRLRRPEHLASLSSCPTFVIDDLESCGLRPLACSDR